MKKQMTIAEAQDAIDEILDAIEEDPTTRVEVLNDDGTPIAEFVSPDFHEQAIRLPDEIEEEPEEASDEEPEEASDEEPEEASDEEPEEASDEEPEEASDEASD